MLNASATAVVIALCAPFRDLTCGAARSMVVTVRKEYRKENS
jgi:hypothetical protein